MAASNRKRKGKHKKRQSGIAAMNHPLRRIILRHFIEQQETGNSATNPAGLRDKLGAPLANISYHFRVLNECDLIVLVEESPVRGAVKHMYKATTHVKQRWVRDLLSIYEGPDRLELDNLKTT